MDFLQEFDSALMKLQSTAVEAQQTLERLRAELEFASRLAEHYSDKTAEWQALILEAAETARSAFAAGATALEAVEAAEAKLAPLGPVAKQYTIHCVGHAHIDMNWMWSWPETVATINDTFTTVDRLMDEVPDFKFSQDQTSIYQAMKDYLPDLLERVKQRVAEGRWEVTANEWVEGDKNLASGEILCRHVLYTKRFFKEEFGFDYDKVKFCFNPDTFGHAHTLPTILKHGGIRWYYFCRGGQGPQLFWFQGKDGSRILAWDDNKQWYQGELGPFVTQYILEFDKQYGLKHYLYPYGVGDHGGGPTRSQLAKALEMDAWPIFPNVKLSTYEAFFSAIEPDLPEDLPVVDKELNFVFEGCYTSQSNIKYANRKSEVYLVEAETAALLAKGIMGMAYPADGLRLGWRHAMFNQFHDILPGSGVKDTYLYAQGLFQEIMTQTTMAKTRALRKLAGRINTLASCPCEAPEECLPTFDMANGLGAGQGDLPEPGQLTRRGAGGRGCDTFVVFNPHAWQQTKVVTTRLWDRDWADHQLVVQDDAGNQFPVQVVSKGGFWAHRYIEIAFQAANVEGLGWRTYSVFRSPRQPELAAPCSGDGAGSFENEFLKVKVDQESGAVVSLMDKQTGLELVPEGARLGLLEYLLEAPHGMTAWSIGQIVERKPFLSGATLEPFANGPWTAGVRVHHKLNDSTFTLTISVSAGVPQVDFDLQVHWLERGAPDIGVPMLKMHFPVAVEAEKAAFEAPNGHVERPCDGREVPAQKWLDLTGTNPAINQPVGVTLLNDCKYGFSVKGNDLCATLIRSSYDPDKLPELGDHRIKFAVRPHIGAWSVADSTRAGYEFNVPFNVIGTTAHAGELPASKWNANILTDNVMISALKQAEDSEAVIVRLYEMTGQACTAQIELDATLVPEGAPAVECDLLERPLESNTARFENGVLSVEMPAFGLKTIKLG